MRTLGKSTFVGLAIGLAFVIGGIVATGQVGLFWNLPSFFIIVGGTVGSFVMSFPPSQIKTFGPVIKKAFTKDGFNLKEDILALAKLSEISRTQGLLSLENYVDEYIEDEFLKKGVMLLVDGADEEQLRYKLGVQTHFMKQRHQKQAAMVDMLAATAPALGLLGTYVGLIPMLNNLDDPAALGPMMALELVSSFYGAFIAYVIFSPLAKRLKVMGKEEVTRRTIVIEGLVAVQTGKNPRIIKAELSEMARINVDEPEPREEKATMMAGEVTNQA